MKNEKIVKLVLIIATLFFVILVLDFNYSGYKKYGLEADDFIDGLAIFEVDNRQGVINEDGDIIIPAIYDEVIDCNSELFAISEIGSWGFMDKNGKVLIEPEFSFIEEFGEDLILLSDVHDHGVSECLLDDSLLIDASGNIINKFSDSFIYSLTEGLAAVETNSKWGYIDKNGDIIIDFKFDYASDFKNGEAQASVKVGTDIYYYIINKKGEIIETLPYAPESREKDQEEKLIDEEEQGYRDDEYNDENDEAYRYWYVLDERGL